MRSRLVNVVLLLLATASQAQPSRSDTLKIVLLGTGSGPGVRVDRYGPSLLVEAGDEKLLFDCGRGALLRLTQAGVSLQDVTKLFVTHLHSDHILDIPDLLLAPWGGRSTRTKPLEVWGPQGTVGMMDHLQQAFAYDIRIRQADQKLPAAGIRVVSHDIGEGVVYERNDVKVTAFLVDHGMVQPAFGYRVDYAGRSVAISGDTRPSENLIRFSKGVDVLVHEVLDPDESSQKPTRYTKDQLVSIIDHHTAPEEAGEVFSKVKPRLAVFSHTRGNPGILPKARSTYTGRMEVGEDLMMITVGEEIEVKRLR